MSRQDIRRPGPSAASERTPLDEVVAPKLPWVTSRRVIVFVIAWLAGFSLASIAISNPFAAEASADAVPNYWHVMYLHGLLIGMVGLMALVTLEVFEACCSQHVRTWIVLGVVGATVLTAMGGIFDRVVPGDEAAMWTQIAGFFFLDEILILLLVGFWQGWRVRSSRTIPYLVGWMAAFSMLMAAILGHIAGWILEFNNHPGIINTWAKWAGEDWGTLRDNLIGAHSHDMAVAAMSLVLTTAVYKFGYREASGLARQLSRFGSFLVAVGVFWMTGLYVAMGVQSWQPGAFFTSSGGTNGIAGDDLVTGIFVMGGGLLALWPLVVRLFLKARPWNETALPLAAAWAWTGTLIGVAVGGYWIEEDETFFGGAKGASGDNIFTWVHQDIGLFLLPALFTILLLADRLVVHRYKGVVGWTSISAITMLLIGGGVWVFTDPVKFGAGYALSTIGMVLVGASIAVTVAAGLRGDTRLRLAPHILHRHHTAAARAA